MLKSPEEYLSSLEFDAGSPGSDKRLNAEEWAFVEKYMGLDAFRDLPEATPESVPLLQAAPDIAPAPPVLLADREIVVAPPKEDTPKDPAASTLESLPDQQVPPALLPVLLEDSPLQLVVAPEARGVDADQEEIDSESPAALGVEESVPHAASQEEVVPEEAAATAKTEITHESAGSAEREPAVNPAVSANEEIAEEVKAESAIATSDAPPAVAARAAPAHLSPAALLQQAETQLKERLKLESEVQMVSFFVGGQIFLLPVAGIQEVLRHMELIKVPQAPYFVAGVINLRGRVTPVVHLSALVTNAEIPPYTESNFIIITGTESLQLGLIIDKVSSMHMVPQNKIIWNAESKLAEAAEFLSAIVDLDDRVCGVVSPEMITRLILPET